MGDRGIITDARYKRRGLITLEAACIFPIIFLVIYFFLCFFHVTALQENLHEYAAKVAKKISSYGGIVNQFMTDPESLQESLSKESSDPVTAMFDEIDLDSISGKVIDSLAVQGMFYPRYHNNRLVKQCIHGGFQGISFLGSSLIDEDGYVTIRMTYQIKVPMLDKLNIVLPVTQQVRIRSFTGFAVPSRLENQEKEEDTSENVYITEHGSVYHTNINCTYLKISVHGVLFASISSIRNKSGAKYYRCSRCFGKKTISPENVYVTSYGTSYHLNSDCTAIKREVRTVKKSEVPGMCECKRCQTFREKGD